LDFLFLFASILVFSKTLNFILFTIICLAHNLLCWIYQQMLQEPCRRICGISCVKVLMLLWEEWKCDMWKAPERVSRCFRSELAVSVWRKPTRFSFMYRILSGRFVCNSR
jgi:hypothetical protein